MKAKIINKKVLLEKNVINCGDKNAQKITFEIPSVIDGVTLTGVPVYVKTENSLGEVLKTLLTSAKSGDNLLIEWLLGAEATTVSGDLRCQLVFENSAGTLILNTCVFCLEIRSSVKENGVKITTEYNHITQMQNQLVAALENTLQEGDNVTKLTNDAGYLNYESAQEYFLDKEQGLPVVTQENSGEYLSVNQNGKWENAPLPLYEGEIEDNGSDFYQGAIRESKVSFNELIEGLLSAKFIKIKAKDVVNGLASIVYGFNFFAPVDCAYLDESGNETYGAESIIHNVQTLTSGYGIKEKKMSFSVSYFNGSVSDKNVELTQTVYSSGQIKESKDYSSYFTDEYFDFYLYG